MRCLPFTTNLYRDLQQQGLDAAGLWNRRERYGRDQGWPHSPDALEDHLLWLISVECSGVKLMDKGSLAAFASPLWAGNFWIATHSFWRPLRH